MVTIVLSLTELKSHSKLFFSRFKVIIKSGRVFRRAKKLIEMFASRASLPLPVVHSCLTAPEQKSALHKSFGLWSQEHPKTVGG